MLTARRYTRHEFSSMQTSGMFPANLCERRHRARPAVPLTPIDPPAFLAAGCDAIAREVARLLQTLRIR
jgi:hypothetical protein